MGGSTEGRRAGLCNLGEFIHQIFNILLGFNLGTFIVLHVHFRAFINLHNLLFGDTLFIPSAGPNHRSSLAVLSLMSVTQKS